MKEENLHLYTYDLDPIDNFHGMTLLNEYLPITFKHDNSCCYLSHREIEYFLIKCFFNIKLTVSCWDGDIRYPYIAISAIPSPLSPEAPFKFIAFKQENGGLSFIVSEIELPMLGKRHNSYNCNIPQHQLFSLMKESYELVYEIDQKLCEDNLKDHLIHQEKLNLKIDFERYINSIQEEIINNNIKDDGERILNIHGHKEKKEGFDLDEYEKI